MEVIMWIQNSDEDNEDFVYEDFSLMNGDSMERQQQHISEMLDSKKKSKELLLDPYLKIYNRRNHFLIDLKTDDLDKYDRKGAVMIFLKNYQHEDDQITLKNHLNKIFLDTATIVSDETINKILFETSKKKVNTQLLNIV